MNRHGKEPRFHGKVSKKSHKNMSHIRGKDTSIEVKLRKALFAKGYRFRKNYKAVPGTPDIAFTKYRIAIFCDEEPKSFNTKYKPNLDVCMHVAEKD